MNRESLIDHVAERLDIFAAVIATKKPFDDRNRQSPEAKIVAQTTYHTILREHAARLTDAVLVLARSDMGMGV